MSKSIGDGLDALATALFLIAVLVFIYKCGAGFVHSFNGYTQNQARCTSINGVYGSGKCYLNGNEMFIEK